MSSTANNADRVSTRVQVSIGRLLALIWGATVANKRLILAIIALGICQAVLTKAPLALVKPLLDTLTGELQGEESLAEEPLPEDRWTPGAVLPGVPGAGDPLEIDDEFFQGLANSAVGFLGLEMGSPQLNLIVACALLVALCGILGAPTIYGVLVLSRYFATKIVVDLRNDVAEHMLRLPLRFYGRRRMGELISNITNDTSVLARSFSLAVDHVVVDPLLILANAAILLWFLPESVLVLLVMVPAMAIPIHRMGRRVRKTSSRTLAAMGDATESMNQMLTGIRTVKAFQLEDQRLADFRANNARYLRRTVGMLRAKALAMASVHLGYMLTFAVLFLIMGWLVVQGQYSFTAIAATIAPLATTYAHVKRLTRAYNTLNESAGALEGVESLLGEAPGAGADGTGLAVPTLRGEVALEHVSFAYGTEPVLHDVSFTGKPGQVIALVGPSGAGKSTTLDLLARFHDPTSGRILIDGRDLRELSLTDYRKHIAVVSQHPFLFNASIRDNILCGRPDATQADLERAAGDAQIRDFIAQLPEGYDSLVGERGCNLSGGEMQRLTIARAILRDPRILILDEAYSALDSESEKLVQKALHTLMVGRTSFVIAHRLSTIASADLIVVLEQGRVMEMGTHEELINRHGIYRRMRDLQATR